MKKVFITLGILISAIIVLQSCKKEEANKENEIIDFNSSTNLNKQKLLDETSILIGNILKNDKLQSALKKKMSEVDEDGQIVSFGYLFNKENGLRKNEVNVFEKKLKNSENIFKEAIKNELTLNTDKYRYLKSIFKNSYKEDVKSSSSIADDLANLLSSEKLQIFYPFDPEYQDNNRKVDEYYVTYAPLNGEDTNYGYKFDDGNSEYTMVDDLNNDFLDENPVYVIVPIDPCDIPGEPCDYTELIPSPDGANGELIPSDDYKPSSSNPTTELVTTNLNHTTLPDTDIISAYIPRIRINGKSWLGFGATHQKLTFYRGSADGTITVNNDGSINVTGTKYLIKNFRTKRKNVKKANWLDFNAEFDPDWQKSENTQVLVVFSKHHFATSATVEFNVKAGLKYENGEIIPVAEATRSAKVKFTLGSAKFRANAEMSRRYFLATIIGNGTTGKTINDGGVNYNVKKVGIIDYYMKFIEQPFKTTKAR